MAVDVQATLLELTAQSIAQALQQQSAVFKHLLVCGGGAHNTTLLSKLRQLLPHLEVDSTEAVSIDPNFIEAQMMGWLAYQMISNIPQPLTAITGAKHNAILGVFYPAGIDN